MNKSVLTAILALSVFLLGCSTISNVGSSSSTSAKILRKAELASKWELMQMSLELGAGDQLPILLKLADGDKVDGYFYLEKGNNVDFQIMANSLVYKPAQDASKGITSDRFAFTASTAQGGSYTLTFSNTASGSEKQTVTIFMEVVYPATGSIFTLLENK